VLKKARNRKTLNPLRQPNGKQKISQTVINTPWPVSGGLVWLGRRQQPPPVMKKHRHVLWQILKRTNVEFRGYAKRPLQVTDKILRRVTDEEYTQKVREIYNASIGEHFRHLISHYESLLVLDAVTPVAKYDLRQRATLIETDRLAAIQRNGELLDRLNDETLIECDVCVEFMSDASDPQGFLRIKSNLSRELVFVGHHATHHIAMIKLLLKHLGCQDESAEFEQEGLAVPTRQFRNN